VVTPLIVLADKKLRLIGTRNHKRAIEDGNQQK
jgi:hypothetical protein